MTAFSWLDWKLGTRMLLKYPALPIIGVITDLRATFPADWREAAYIHRAASAAEFDPVAVQRRTREIGIRVALGDNPRFVPHTVFARAGRPLGGGIIARRV